MMLPTLSSDSFDIYSMCGFMNFYVTLYIINPINHYLPFYQMYEIIFFFGQPAEYENPQPWK